MGDYEDRRVQKEYEKNFKICRKNVQEVVNKLDTYMKAIRPFGSSSGLIKTSEELQNGFHSVLQAFQTNSTELCAEFSGTNDFPINPTKPSADTITERLPLVLAGHMITLSGLLFEFLRGLREIPEFSDKPLADALRDFQAWLNCRARLIESHEECPLVQNFTTRIYIGQVMREMSLHTGKMRGALDDFVSKGVTAVKNAQEKSQAWLRNMSTVAAFLAGVTAATMQYDVQRNKLGTVVMGLWISSLILSIAAVVNSQLAIFWRAAIYRSPRSMPTTGIAVSPEEAPLFCLTGAVLAFSVGLVIWTIASDLALPVKICAAVVTLTTYAVIFIVVIRVVKDWWTRTDWTIGGKPRDDARSCTEKHPGHCPWPDWRKETISAVKGEDESWVFVDPPSTSVARLLLGWHRLIRLISGLPLSPPMADNASSADSIPPPDDALRTATGPGMATLATEGSDSEAPSISSGLSDVQSRRLPPTPRVSLTHIRLQTAVVKPINSSQFQLDDLKKLRPVHTLPIFHPEGYDMHFSPDGTYLGVGCIEGAVAIWKVGSVYKEPEVVLASPTGRFGWSPDGSYVLVITKEGPSILEKDSWHLHCQPKVPVTAPISVVAWLQSSCAFILAIDAVLYVFDAQLLPRVPHAPVSLPIEVHDVASIPSSSEGQYGFILVVGSLYDEAAQTQKGPEANGQDMRVDEPSIVCPEHWLMVIDLDAPGGGRSVAEAPTLADARHICVSKDGHHAIISYADRSCPELWQLQDDSGNMQLMFRRRFRPPDPETPRRRNHYSSPATSGKARFCGKSDAWVLATDGRSTIYIWDRYSGFLVHTLEGSQIRPQINDSGITAVTSTIKQNQKASPIVVSACKRGGVIVWENPDEGEAQPESASEGETSQAGATHSNPLQCQSDSTQYRRP